MKSRNGGYHARINPIDTLLHFIRDCVEKRKILVNFLKTNNQVTDIFTKSLGRMKFEIMGMRMGLRAWTLKDRGGECG